MSGVTDRLGVLKELAVALGSTADEDVRVKLAVEAATSLVERCSHAGFTVNDAGGLSNSASSDKVVRRANDLQQELGEGPCLDVMRDQDTLVSRDLAHDRRWPRWASQVHDELGVDSLISVLVYTDATAFGALSLYAGLGVEFDDDDTAIAQMLAGQMALTMSSGREIDQLGRAGPWPHCDRPGARDLDGTLRHRLGPGVRLHAADLVTHQHQAGRDCDRDRAHPHAS